MYNFYKELVELFEENSDIVWGISNIDFSECKKFYKCSLVMAIPHKEIIEISSYKEEKFEKLIHEARNRINVILEDIKEILEKYKIKYYVPPVAQSSEETLVAPFSFKFAAINAGLGWIGKNGVLITEKYGPRVRLSSILIDYDLPVGTLITKSKCPEECNLCVDICPYKALIGHTWNINSKRDELINYKLCNEKRSFYLKTHNRKNSCGLCMVVCPIGTK